MSIDDHPQKLAINDKRFVDPKTNQQNQQVLEPSYVLESLKLYMNAFKSNDKNDQMKKRETPCIFLFCCFDKSKIRM